MWWDADSSESWFDVPYSQPDDHIWDVDVVGDQLAADPYYSDPSLMDAPSSSAGSDPTGTGLGDPALGEDLYRYADELDAHADGLHQEALGREIVASSSRDYYSSLGTALIGATPATLAALSRSGVIGAAPAYGSSAYASPSKVLFDKNQTTNQGVTGQQLIVGALVLVAGLFLAKKIGLA